MLGNETVSCFSFLFHKPSGTGDSNRRSGGQNRPSGDSSSAHWTAHKKCERGSKSAFSFTTDKDLPHGHLYYSKVISNS